MKYMIFTLMLCLALVISCDKPDVEEPKDNQEQTDNTGDSQGGEEDEGGKDDENNDGSEGDSDGTNGGDENQGGDNSDSGDGNGSGSEGGDDNEFDIDKYIFTDTPPGNEIWFRMIEKHGDGTWGYCYGGNYGKITILTDCCERSEYLYTYGYTLSYYILDFNDYFSHIYSVSVDEGDCYAREYHHLFIAIPSSVTTIADEAFKSCKSLTRINIPSGVTKIGSSAFYDCSSLTSIEIPSGVTEIESYAFEGCSNLTYMSVGEGNPKYDSRDNSNAIIETSSNTLISGCKSTTIPSSVTKIGSYAFSRCSSLTSIEIPSSVTEIESYAFSGCSSLTSIEIPSGVTKIESYAFEGCSSLKSMYLRATTPPSLGSSVFSSCPAVFYVPMEAVEAYKNAEGWSKYASDRIVGYNFN